MNFFGHAALAAGYFAEQAPAPHGRELALLCAGAMLPDFVGMLRLGRPQVLDESLARGVSFHHQTDHAFHELESFHGLSRAAFAWLTEHQFPRGPARAVAHIGIEILLDEVLAGDAQARAAYRAALETSLDGALSFPAVDDAARLAGLRRTLLERGSSEASPAAELVAERICRTLAGRPRLRTEPSATAELARWVALTRPLVASAAPGLLATLRARLANSDRPE
jgi:hypothetical protein